MVLALFAVNACVVERIPDVPSNVAIQLLVAFQLDDDGGVESLICESEVGTARVDLGDLTTLGDLGDFFESARTNSQEGINAFGGDSEYSLGEQVDLDVEHAWTEIEFRGGDATEVWRLQMVREDGKWKACDAELRS